MEVLASILFFVGGVVVSSFLSRFIPKVSTPLVQIVLGLLLSRLPFFPRVDFDPMLFMVLFIAPLLYDEARSIDKVALHRNLKLSLSLAVGLAVATMAAVGFALHAAWPAIPLAGALALGAALGPTDAVAVSSLGREAALSERQSAILKGESLFNDATGIVGFQFAIGALILGEFRVGRAIGEFLVMFVGGTLLGLVVGHVMNRLFETMRAMGWEDTTSRILMEVSAPPLLYVGAEELGVSGVLAVVTAGLVARFDRTGVGPNVSRTNIVSSSVWSVIGFSLNGTVFLLLGLQLPDVMSASWRDPNVSNAMLIGLIAIACLVSVGMRLLWVSAMLWLSRDQRTGRRRPMTWERWRSALVMTIGGPKGTVTLALMMTMPLNLGTSGASFPMRGELLFVASGVIVVTLLLANFALPLLAPDRTQGVRAAMDGKRRPIVIEVLRRTIGELGDRSTPETRPAVEAVIASYMQRIDRLKRGNGLAYGDYTSALQIQALAWEYRCVKDRAASLPEDSAERAAADMLVEHIGTALSHLGSIDERESPLDTLVRRVHQRISWLRRRWRSLIRRAIGRIRRSAPMISDDVVFECQRRLQLEAFNTVIARLYDELDGSRFPPEEVSALIVEYRRAKTALVARPNVGRGAARIGEIERVKRESYAIELEIIDRMARDGEITRADVKALRSNVFVMSVDAA